MVKGKIYYSQIHGQAVNIMQKPNFRKLPWSKEKEEYSRYEKNSFKIDLWNLYKILQWCSDGNLRQMGIKIEKYKDMANESY